MDYPDFPPKHPLLDSIHHVVQAILTAGHHLRERKGKFTEQDVHLLGRLRETMWIQYFQSAQMLDMVRIAFAEQPEAPPEKGGKPR
jgi:hypothetical protein